MDIPLKETLMRFLESGPDYQSWELLIRSALTTHSDTFDRHFSSYSQMKFKLERFYLRFSGARAVWEGEGQYYEIGMDYVISLEEERENEFVLIEKYGEKLYRRSYLRFEEG